MVPNGATLNLNGLHLYVRGEEIGSQATIFNGTVTLIPGGGPIAKNTAVPADMTNVGEQDDWTFFGFAGETVTIAVDPGDSGVLAAPSPQLGWVTVNLLDQYGDVLADGDQRHGELRSERRDHRLHLRVPRAPTRSRSRPRRRARARRPRKPSPTARASTRWRSTTSRPQVNPLVLGQPESGTVDGPFGVAEWTFSGTANELVQLTTAAADSGIVFNLTGPGSFSLTGLTQGQQITLPASGNYVLSVDGTGTNGVNYDFELDQLTIDPLVVNAAPLPETTTGTGYSQLYEVSLSSLSSPDALGHRRRQHADRRQLPLRQVRLGADAVELQPGLFRPGDGRPQHPDLVGGPGQLVFPGLFGVGAGRQRLHDRRHRRSGAVERGQSDVLGRR